MSAERYITPRVVDHLKAQLPAVPRKRRPSFGNAQCVLRHLARWARRDAEGCWVASDSVGQVAVGTGLTDSTVRACLDALTAAGLALTVRRGGGQGISARGSTRVLHLDDPTTARMNTTGEENGVAGLARGVEVQNPRSSGAQPAEFTPRTPRANPAEFPWVPAPAGASRMWADDADIEAAPPPVADTLAAIRAWRAGGPAPVLAPLAGTVLVAVPPATKWAAEGLTYGEWMRRERAAGRQAKHYQREAP